MPSADVVRALLRRLASQADDDANGVLEKTVTGREDESGDAGSELGGGWDEENGVLAIGGNIFSLA